MLPSPNPASSCCLPLLLSASSCSLPLLLLSSSRAGGPGTSSRRAAFVERAAPHCTSRQKTFGSSMRKGLDLIPLPYHGIGLRGLAAMDAGRLEQQVASVERGIAFLKHEHLAMLAGLQLEITHLKRRCHGQPTGVRPLTMPPPPPPCLSATLCHRLLSPFLCAELSCELDSRFHDRTTAEEEADLAARCEAAERLLERQQCVMLAARGELRAGRARASALGRSLRDEERRFLDELKRRSHQITLLSRELQRQNLTTTALYHQLHAARLKLFRQRQREGAAAGGEQGAGGQEEDEEEEEEEEEDEEDEDGEGEDSDWLLSPPPPASPDHPDARKKKRLSLREDRVRACVPQERVTSPQRPHPMPDPALFLVPLRYRLLRLRQPTGLAEAEGVEDEWEDIEDSRVHRRVDMGAGEGETAL
ncbi:unnamed protein product [Menidia menidia]|uniref:(Atlantic silverside) hypothetical protein n=1 Tax=Menidia menidia TaxID=238744 RepID=A0A8S4AV02_9TELE|nr:unnamed protein product [Menidia menidia]